jgi:hypothetical protein
MPCLSCFNSGKDPVPIVNEVGWDPGPVWTGVENLTPTVGFDSQAAQTIVITYTDYAIPGRTYVVLNTKKIMNSNNMNSVKIPVIKIFMLVIPSNFY